ncbi:MAG: hypothetical protein IRY99_26945, partial [Isosphaeraceae bacterium]|nr:hypothetical protein [Isosphaeraceae bacterium]
MIGLIIGCVLLMAEPGGDLDAEAHIRRALQAEASGDLAERDRHLARALEENPAHPKARALLGLLADRGEWVRPEEVGRRDRQDGATAAALAEYNARRARMSNTFAAHWNLADWCERRGLKAEAIAHFTAATRLRPESEAPWKRLGYVRVGRRWMTPEQRAEQRAEEQAQAQADRRWWPRLVTWRHRLDDAASRPEALRSLDEVRDPRAVPMVWTVFGQGPPRDQAVAVRVLDHIDAPLAARALARLAVVGTIETIQEAAADRLEGRDPRAYLGLLIGWLQAPVPYRVLRPVEGPGLPGILEFDTPRAIIRRLYD